MQVAVLCSEAQRQELGTFSESITFVEAVAALAATPAMVFIDLLFEENKDEHLPMLRNLAADAVVVHLVSINTRLPQHFIRINGWPTFLSGPMAEVAGGTIAAREKATKALDLLGKVPEWVPDVPGFVAPRIIAAIINEAYFTLAEGIASKESIDTAMKLGTAYPYGPFEWAQRIGLSRIAALLRTLSQAEARYEPCPLLLAEAG